MKLYLQKRRCKLLLLFCFILFLHSKNHAQEIKQKVTITGTVRDNVNAVLNGVTIINLNTGKIAVTNTNGAFSIEATKGDSLKASYVGYLDYKWVFSDQLNFDIALTAATGSLNDVAVVGYGQQKKITVVGAQSTINAQEIQAPVANLSTMLAGRISGIVGVQRTGLPGSNTSDIWIRGISTFGDNNGTTPLVVIDGVQGRSIDDFDPEDIESFTILKDASATAVYGALGANGVIIINTKHGKTQKVSLMANYLEGITAFTKLPKMADAGTYMNLRNEAEIASGNVADYSQTKIDSTLSPTANHYVYPNVNWMKLLFRNLSSNRRLNFSATGGTENVQFYTSVAYYEESSLLNVDASQSYNAETRYQRYNYVSNIDMKWTKTTKFSLGITGYITQLNQPGSGSSTAFTEAMEVNPVRYPAMYPGNLVAGIAEGSNPSANPYADITQKGYQQTFGSEISATTRLDQDLSFLLKGLSANGQFSFDTYSTNTQSHTRQRSTYYLNQSSPYNSDGSLNLYQTISGSDVLSYGYSYSQTRQFSLQGQVQWQRSFGDHNVNAMLVYSQLSIPNPTATSESDAIPERTQNYAARVTYNYQNKYLAEFDAGYTGSQVFSPENRYGFFPSLGVGWVLSSENFWKPLSNIFQFFKLRYSNGYSGAVGGTRFDYITTITTSALGITFGTPSSSTSYSGINISHYGANVKWATSHDQDVGLEFKVLNNKLSVVLDWFNKYRTGIFLTRANFPGFAGLQYNPDGNYGITQNRGFDGTLELFPIPITNKLSVAFRGTFTYNKDKLLENGAAPYEESYMDPRGQNILASDDYGYVAEGLFQSQAEIDNHADQSGVGGSARVGDIKYKDLNGDGVVDTYDETYLGHGDVPSLTFGLGFNLQYGPFYLSAFFEGIEGADRMISSVARSPFSGSEDANVFANVTDRWTEDNQAKHPFYPRLAYGSSANANNDVASSWWVKDISFIRFKTLDLGYNLPKSMYKHIAARDARIYVDCVNLLYWSPFKLWDPELDTGDGNTYPNTRNFSIGLQIHF
ncbi:SusC/RagA family TonB-linked outer membrane protein [Parafilimonas sp.]|uniref:SusC/RagA family TonB-linked outer membrane protein n=1 Tax=Parafilimonas sp. TaxID=1969739 RepID=UPI0039E53560